MTDLETDPKLLSLLIPTLIQENRTMAEEYLKLRADYEARVLASVTRLAKVFLETNPNVTAVGWETTSGEYNDNGYDGYTISSPNFKYRADLHLEGGMYNYMTHQTEAVTYCTFSEESHPDCENTIDPNEWDGDENPVKQANDALLSEISISFQEIDQRLETDFGVGIIYFNKDGLFSGSD